MPKRSEMKGCSITDAWMIYATIETKLNAFIYAKNSSGAIDSFIIIREL